MILPGTLLLVLAVCAIDAGYGGSSGYGGGSSGYGGGFASYVGDSSGTGGSLTYGGGSLSYGGSSSVTGGSSGYGGGSLSYGGSSSGTGGSSGYGSGSLSYRGSSSGTGGSSGYSGAPLSYGGSSSGTGGGSSFSYQSYPSSHSGSGGTGYGSASLVSPSGYSGFVFSTPEAQSDVEAPAYMPSYLKNQQFTKTYHSYSGTKTGGTKTYHGTKTGGGGYSSSKQWFSSSGEAPTYKEFFSNANQVFKPKCEQECKNSGICVDTNTCECPSNFHGKYCEFEKKPCLNYPPLPMNSKRQCSSEHCTITCMEGHKFIDGSSVANMLCVEGQWTPSRADLTTIPDCEPECNPPCLNGGVCLGINTCSCPTDYRGPQCQYSITACDVHKLGFNGAYKCAGDGEKFTCKLSCAAGAKFSARAADAYTCLYSIGVFEPQPIPHCEYPEVVVISPTNHQLNTSFYEIHTSEGHNASIGGGYSFHGHGQGQGHEHYGGGSYSVVIQDLTPKGGVCLTWAGAHYKTFDGAVYTFQSPCQHILLREPKEHKYTIAVKQKDCSHLAYCPSEITVYLEEKPYILAISEDGSVIFRNTKRLIPIPASLPGLRVSMPGDYVVVNLDAHGVTIKWDTNNLIQIEGSVLLWNKTEGLCGILDGNPANDLTTKDGQVAHTSTLLASSWQMNIIGDICETSPTETAACATDSAADVARAAKFCNEMISSKKFRKCSKVMDVVQFLEACKWDYCACTKTLNGEECACRAISVYAKECLRHGVDDMKNWRDEDTCPMKCPDGKLYQACGPDVQPSCAFPLTTKSENGSCVEGCFCPEGLLLEAGKCVTKEQCPCRHRNKSFLPGKVIKKDCNTCTCASGTWACTKQACGARCRAVGDPHYTSFDGHSFDFMGPCSYTMLQAPDTRLEVENVACSGAITEAMNLTPYKGKGKPSCTKAVTVEYGGVTAHLSQGGIITVNGREVTDLPVTAGDVIIRAASSLFLIVQLPNKVDIWWDGNTRVFVDVPAEFQGKTKGLCGTFNLNQNDDFLTPEGDVEQSTHAFANKWKTREFCSDETTEEPQHPCQANVENKEAAEKYCSILKGKVFESCHWHVDVESFYEWCVYDMCACGAGGDVSRCLCPLLGDYAMACAKQGVEIQWRYNVKECEVSCTGGQQYTVCADSCARTCSDMALTSCKPSCVEGCACPPGQLLDDKHVCVPVALCPCYHKGLQFPAGYREVRAGRREKELCTCVGARWGCEPATPDDVQNYPPAEDMRTNCSAAAGMEFTTCAMSEPLTCKNMHLPPQHVLGECRPGCRCRKGLVLEKASGKCVSPTACPCHHGGASYPDGHVMQEACNTCECKSGNWSCTTKQCDGVCSAWGDSHIVSFDDKQYDFEGVCTYLLAKGNMDGTDGFEVEIQNVPCGTTGATCSKSVTLKVGRNGDEEVVSLTRDVPLPDISKLKRIKLRVAGAYVFLDVPSLGMSLQWDRGLRLYVKVDPMWRGRVKGLCGNFNDDSRDDFQTPTGGGLAEASPLIFADSWKLKPTCPKAQPVTEHCAQRSERKDWAESTCGILKEYPFTLCHGEVPVTSHVERCARDACACDAGGDCACACAAIAHYAHQCLERGVAVKWRTQDLCPMQCDEECSNYDACISPCPPESCENTLYYEEVKTTCSKETCVEGCKPKKSCPEGTVYKNGTTTECVPRAKCKPVCMRIENGTEIHEGGVIEEDECHICRCSKHTRVCTGQPCSTPVPPEFSPKPHDEPMKCVTGWTPWINRFEPETEAGTNIEHEPLPKPKELIIGSPMCKFDKMTNVECRTVDGHKTAKETGLNVECSLERGLVCKEEKAKCPDFEIRVFCQCGDESPNPCINMTKSPIPHPEDCAKFIECGADGPVVKTCGPGTLFNPTTDVCDWPLAVYAVRPECGATTYIATETTTQTVTEATKFIRNATQPVTEATQPATPPPRCPPGQVYRDCAYHCDKLCDHFKKTLMDKGRCVTEKCVDSCMYLDVANIKCEYGSYWRDERTCVPKKDCTCFSEGKIIKPGGVLTVEGCIHCQCLDNELHCDSSSCISVLIPDQGATHQPYIHPQVKASSEPTFTTRRHVVTTRTPVTTGPPVVTTGTPVVTIEAPVVTTGAPVFTTRTPVFTPIFTTATPKWTEITRIVPTEKGEPRLIETEAPKTTGVTVIIAKSTSTPPPLCHPDDYVNLMWSRGVPTITASSFLNDMYAPEHAELDAGPLDISAGSWNPSHGDKKPYIQVELPERTPIYGVIMQGSPLFDQYVTSYEVMYGDDGVVFHPVEGDDGKPKVFRGPIDHVTAHTQMISPPIEAKIVRIRPLTWHDEVAVRMELIGCWLPSSTVEPITAPVTILPPLQCTEPLGISADLPLDSITTSSNPEDRKYFQLDGDRGWRPLYSTPGEWIMFNFTSPRNITGIKTKGGKKGWVTSYKVLYTCDLGAFNQILANGEERIFPANFDHDSIVTTEFRPPLRAQYLKILPITWNDDVEMRIEPIGCFEPYPTPVSTPATTPTTPSPCEMCPGTIVEACDCAPPLYYDGESCVPRQQCPCMLGFMTYPVGSSFRGENCDECMCKLGGITDCKPVKECKCDLKAKPNHAPKLLKTTCECICEPCPPNTRACSSGICLNEYRWCDAIVDCSDDEVYCTTATVPTTTTETAVVTQTAVTQAVMLTTANPVSCPVVECPPGYQVIYTTPKPRTTWYSSDLPPPRPRYSYQRYYKGGATKTGYSGYKGGFSKGGFSKGGYGGGGLPSFPSQSFTLDKPAITPTPAPTKEEECPQFKCMPHIPKFPNDATAAPVVCSVVSCPQGYTLKLETVKTGFTKCPQYECVPPPEQPTFCNMTGRTFNTFDGVEYKYDVCFHILARENRFDSWTVLVRKKCRDEGCWNELLIHQDDQLIIVKPNLMIEYNNYQYTIEQTSKICFQKNSFDVARLGNGVVIKSRRYNFTVFYNSEGDIKIGVMKMHLGSVDGLCGTYDGDASNERRLPGGALATSVEQFGRGWARPGQEACHPRAIPEHTQKQAWELCNIITEEPFSRCGSVLNLHKWRSICLEKVCACNELAINGTKRSLEQCRCLLLEQLVAECLAASDLDLQDWRIQAHCPAECPAPLVHYDCYRRRCEPSCIEGGVRQGGGGCGAGAGAGGEGGACFPGCYCPAGTLRKGSDCVTPNECNDCMCTGVGAPAKYVTFEGDELPFLGNCTYLASRDRNDTGLHKYEVYATNGPCEDNLASTCTKTVHIIYDKNVIHISKDQSTKKLTTLLGETPIFKYPLKKDWGTIDLNNGQDVTVTIPDIHVEVTVLQSKLEFNVRVPSSLYAKVTDGLCGVCASTQEALVTSNGTLTDDVDEYGSSWQATPTALTALGIQSDQQCDQPPPIEKCITPPSEDNPCNMMLNPDKFGACHALLDPHSYIESCEGDLCTNSSTVCAALERYAADCAHQGVCLHNWRGEHCSYQCESPLIYHSCVDCERTCDNHAELATNPDICDKKPSEGCFCPDGKVRVNNTCIEPSKCFPCDAKKEHYAGDEWQEDACTTCTCTKTGSGAAQVSCTTRACTEPVCSTHDELHTEKPGPLDCCPNYRCVPKTKEECVEPKKMECGFGQVLKHKKTQDGCLEFTCECKPASECAAIDSTSPLEPGMRRVIDKDGCCPRVSLVCERDRCPKDRTCPQFHDLVTKNVTGQCCPEYECVLPKDKCLVRLEWEAAAKGGEQQKDIPNVLFKEIDAEWSDGPCRSCSCAPPGTSGSPPAPRCRVTSCPAPRSTHHVLEPRQVPYACCPNYVQVACRDGDTVHKPGQNWTSNEDVCKRYQCVELSDGQLEKVTNVQHCDEDCQPGWRYIPATSPTECCGKCEPYACVVEGEEREIGARWISPDHCVNYTCVNVDGTLQVQSMNESCPEIPEAVRKQFVLNDEAVPGKCCHNREPVACRVGDKIYQEGQTWPSPDPCKNTTCLRDSTNRLALSESIETCNRDCKPGWRYELPTAGHCCGHCVQHACVVNGELYEADTTWHSDDNCTQFWCSRAGSEVFVTSAREACVDVSGCDPEYIRNDSCCPVCQEPPQALSTCVPTSMSANETVGVVHKHLGEHGLCVNKKAIKGFKECRGTCDSGALYDTNLGIHSSICECCSATKFSPLEVELECDDGTHQPHRVAVPSRCACARCGEQLDKPIFTKTGYSGIKTRQTTKSTVAQDELDEFVPKIYQRMGEFND